MEAIEGRKDNRKKRRKKGRVMKMKRRLSPEGFKRTAESLRSFSCPRIRLKDVWNVLHASLQRMRLLLALFQ
jgi:hypothetical protein